MWHLIFFFLNAMNILSFVYPFLIKFDIRFNILKLKGIIKLTFFNKITLELKIRIKHGYIYINHKKKESKVKISNKNFKFVFITKLIKQLYFREQLLNFNLVSNFGYSNDSMITAVGAGNIDVLTKAIMGKIKNNKKSAHIFVSVEPKYNQDIFNFRIINEIRISVFDFIYTLFVTIFRTISNKVYKKVNEY